jgi:hypothetical protein
MSSSRTNWIDDALVVLNSVNKFLQENPNFIEVVKRRLDSFALSQKNILAQAAQAGWFLNWHTPIRINAAVKASKDDLDNFMITHLTDDWTKISTKITSIYPDRKHIFDVAFQLHKEENHIASIPLLLSQADGICAQNLGTFLFSDHDSRKKRIKSITENSNSISIDILLQVLDVETQFGASISKASHPKKALAPNRNGILHGSRKHLDYGNRINGFKSFSLLAFVVYCFDKTKVTKK